MTSRFAIASTVFGLMLSASIAYGQAPGPIEQAIRAEAARLAAMSPGIATGNVQETRVGLSAWSSLAALDAGSEIVLTRSTGTKVRHRLLSMQDDSLTILDVSSPTIAKTVANELVALARSRPERFAEARRATEFHLGHGVVIAPSGVSRDGAHLFPLSLVVVDVPRDDVTEVSVRRKHIGVHAKRGAIIGAIAGAALVSVGSASCEGDCGNPLGWAVAGAFLGSLTGLEYGFFVGLVWPATDELVYRRETAVPDGGA